ncbi:MAG: flippase-like domain-containing protein [Deltaproteobacteria bacterium]|nr:flippase-like domain-containing protein [Deltaproteobacteria bacterium]MDQ3300508.1 flippase-like domain-containing protein [Myxococcota bacterium]
MKRPGLLRRSWPWLVGLAIIAIIARSVPVDAFREAMTKGPHVLLALVTLAITATVLLTDSFSTWVGLAAIDIRRPLSRVLAVRGATYVLFLINYALGQGAFGYYLNRTGVSGLRAVGVTLFLMGTNLATLLVVTTVAFAIDGGGSQPALWWTLLIGSAAFVVYLVVIVVAPGFLARRKVLAPLFEAGLRGHAIAMVGRLPHTAIIVLGYWVAIRVWGIEVPLWAGITLMPAVAIASVLPISPAGLGTTQAALVYFCSPFAAGATVDERNAQVLAFAVVYFVYAVAAYLVVGLVCTPLAKRLGVMPTAQPVPAEVPG